MFEAFYLLSYFVGGKKLYQETFPTLQDILEQETQQYANQGEACQYLSLAWSQMVLVFIIHLGHVNRQGQIKAWSHGAQNNKYVNKVDKLQLSFIIFIVLCSKLWILIMNLDVLFVLEGWFAILFYKSGRFITY